MHGHPRQLSPPHGTLNYPCHGAPTDSAGFDASARQSAPPSQPPVSMVQITAHPLEFAYS
eukprot:819996-Amphidinium_carterae.2